MPDTCGMEYARKQASVKKDETMLFKELKHSLEK